MKHKFCHTHFCWWYFAHRYCCLYRRRRCSHCHRQCTLSLSSRHYIHFGRHHLSYTHSHSHSHSGTVQLDHIFLWWCANLFISKKQSLNVNKQQIGICCFLLLVHCHYYIKLKCGSRSIRTSFDPIRSDPIRSDPFNVIKTMTAR